MDRFTPFPSLRFLWGFIGVAWLVLFLVRMSAPSDLMDNDQERPAAYVLDCLLNGHWASQRDPTGDVMSKPPFYTWLAAGFSAVLGAGNLWALYLPGALAVLLTCWLIFAFGGVFHNRDAGFYAALAYLFAPTTYKQLALARTDPVFAFLVFLSAMLLFTAWLRGRGRTAFWVAAALATLTKGPLVLLFASGGLFALLLERRRARSLANAPISDLPKAPASRLIHPAWLVGLGLFLLITGAWFFAAWAQDGRDFINKVILKELAGHALQSRDKTDWWSFVQPPLWFLARFAPWSLLACLGVWRSLARPSREADTRRLHYFLSSYLVFGVVVLAVASHKRGDLLFPLYPAAALLAGRELAALLPLGRPRVLALVTLASVLAIFGLGVYSHEIRPHKPQVARTAHAIETARLVRGRVGAAFPWVDFEAPYAVQFFLGTMRPRATAEQVRELLTGPAAAFVMIGKRDRFESETGLRVSDFHILYETPDEVRPRWALVGNRPALEYGASTASILHGLWVRVEGLRVVRGDRSRFAFRGTALEGLVRFENRTESPKRVRVLFLDAEPERVEWVLAPGESAEIPFLNPD